VAWVRIGVPRRPPRQLCQWRRGDRPCGPPGAAAGQEQPRPSSLPRCRCWTPPWVHPLPWDGVPPWGPLPWASCFRGSCPSQCSRGRVRPFAPPELLEVRARLPLFLFFSFLLFAPCIFRPGLRAWACACCECSIWYGCHFAPPQLPGGACPPPLSFDFPPFLLLLNPLCIPSIFVSGPGTPCLGV